MRERPPTMTFTESLPADKRPLGWIPTFCFTLTLRLPDGTWTAYQEWRSISAAQWACNVTIYHGQVAGERLQVPGAEGEGTPNPLPSEPYNLSPLPYNLSPLPSNLSPEVP